MVLCGGYRVQDYIYERHICLSILERFRLQHSPRKLHPQPFHSRTCVCDQRLRCSCKTRYVAIYSWWPDPQLADKKRKQRACVITVVCRFFHPCFQYPILKTKLKSTSYFDWATSCNVRVENIQMSHDSTQSYTEMLIYLLMLWATIRKYKSSKISATEWWGGMTTIRVTTCCKFHQSHPKARW